MIAREALRVAVFISSLVLLPLTCDRDRDGDPGRRKSLSSAMKWGGGVGQTMPITGVVEGHGPVTTR